jgi:ankyrin repeat protein
MNQSMNLQVFLNRISLGLALALGLGSTAAISAGAASPLISPEYATILRSGDAAKLRTTLDQGAPIDGRNASGDTPLMLAAVYGDLACMQLLVDRHADINTTNGAGATALMRAADNDQKVALLLTSEADVNARSAFGNTALMLAARPCESHRAVALLLSHGADAKATNLWGATALMAAVAGGDAESVRLLLHSGADVNAQPATSHEAFIFGGGRSALMWAAYRGDVTIIKLLLDAGADVNGVGMLGTPLTQAAWADQTEAARLLIEHGAKVNQAGPMDGYSALHWAASTEQGNPELVTLFLRHGADPNLNGGESVDAFMGIAQTPLMLARRRGDTPILAGLQKAGATSTPPDRAPAVTPFRKLPARFDAETVRSAINRALPPLQETSLESKQAFLRHASHQDCVSCHQQFLPMTAFGLARKQQASLDEAAEQQLIAMVNGGELKNAEADWEALFHPEPVHTKGYALLALAAEDQPASDNTDAWVHHLCVIQGQDGQWYNNLPRPPIQTGDIGATALAVHALQHYPLPGRKEEFVRRVERARHWLWNAKPANTEGRIYQILGLAWAGEPAVKLEALSKALLLEQREDGGWAQLPGLKSDAYATGQAVYTLRVAARLGTSSEGVDRGVRFLLSTQLEDGTWYVRRRAFPFQPTMNSGFPHGRDSWISAAASSWAVMALSVGPEGKTLARRD